MYLIEVDPLQGFGLVQDYLIQTYALCGLQVHE